MKTIGLDAPFFSPVLSTSVFNNDTDVAIAEIHKPLAEVEFAFRLKGDLVAGRSDYSPDDIRAAVGSVHPSLEIVACRVEGGVAGLGMGAIADLGVNGAVVIGEELSAPSIAHLTSVPVKLAVNDKIEAAGTAKQLVWDHPSDALMWLANHPLRSRDLRAGEYILTGTCTGVRPLENSDQIRGDFGAGGTVACRIRLV
nr:fumarylacetoacetate hydrolase family protein [Roseibium limicola]